MFSNKVYDILSKIQRWIPSLSVFYLALCKIWGFALGQQVSDTLMAIAALLAATLEISTGAYHKDVSTQILTNYIDDVFPSEDDDEPVDSDETDSE